MLDAAKGLEELTHLDLHVVQNNLQNIDAGKIASALKSKPKLTELTLNFDMNNLPNQQALKQQLIDMFSHIKFSVEM